MKRIYFLIVVTSVFLASCNSKTQENITPKGKLYIIGGGERPYEMVKQMIDLSGVKDGKYIVVLPMASSVPDSSAIWCMDQFKNNGISNITSFNFRKGEEISQSKIDSLENAGMIYIGGGDQSVFMGIVLNTPIYTAIHNAYKNGAVIAGTSAGAAVMSKKMITGNQLRHPKDELYKHIEPNNIEIAEGLGLLEGAIIDQHFVKRARLNRLISAAIENTNELCIGIDESTAILVSGDSATVCGGSQVIVIDASKAITEQTDSLLKAQNIKLDVLFKGDKFKLKK